MLEIFFQKLKKIIQWFFSTLSRKKSYRFSVIVFCALIIVQWLFPLINFRSLWTNAVGSNANVDIQKSTIFNQAVYVNENKDFRIEFGNKLDKKDGSVRFTAKPFQKEVSEENTGTLAKTKKYLTKVADAVLPTPKKGITFSLSGAQKGVDGNILAKENNEDEFVQGKDQNVVVKKEILPGVDVQYQRLGDEGLKEDIILKDPLTAPDTFLFDLQKDPGVKIYQPISFLNKNGQKTAVNGDTIFFTDERDHYLFHFEKPFAIDASGARTENVKIEIVKALNPKSQIPNPKQITNSNEKNLSFGNLDIQNSDLIQNSKFKIQNLIGDFVSAQENNTEDPAKDFQEMIGQNQDEYQIRLTVDPLWLSDPNRQYPITIDPSIAHDTEGEFDAGLALNRIESIAGPKVQAKSSSGDRYTKLLLHADGTSSSFVDSSAVAKTIVANGNATQSTTQSKFGGSSAYFDGSGDYITTDSASDFDFGTGNFTIDFWVYRSSSSAAGVFSMTSPTCESWINTDAQLAFYCNGYVYRYWIGSVGALSINTWHHIAIVRYGTAENNLAFYFDGVLQTSGTWGDSLAANESMPDVGNFLIGADGPSAPSGWFNGYIDEFRVSKGIARWNSNFSTPARTFDYPKNYSVYTSSVLDFTSTPSSIDSLQWTENGVSTGDGETVFSGTNLVAQWNFNATSGTVANNDAEGTSCGGTPANCDGTLTSFASTSSQDQAAGTGWTADNRKWGAGGLMFDGTNDYVTMGTNSSLDFGSGSFSFGAWVKTSDSSNYKTIISKGSSNSGAAYRYYNRIEATTGAFHSSIADGTNELSMNCGGGFADGQWHYVMTVVNRSTQLMTNYVDGKSICSGSVSSIGNINSTQDFRIGVLGTMGYYFLGIIDGVSVFNRALSADEILSNYNATNIEFQTRTGTDATPDDGTNWEEWKSASGSPETQMDSLDSNPTPDYSTTTLLHLDGANATTIFPDNALFPKTFTPAGNAQISTAQSAFAGGSSALLDGTGDYLSAPDSDDWNFSSGDFTIDFRVKFNSTSGTQFFVHRGGTAGGGTASIWFSYTGSGIEIALSNNGSAWQLDYTAAWSPGTSSWHHIALVRTGTTIKLFDNGTQLGTDQSFTGAVYIPGSYKSLFVGERQDSGGSAINGYLDEFRISKGVARWTSTFTVPTVAYDNLTHISTVTDTIVKMEGTGSEKLISGRPRYDGKTIGLWHLDETGGTGAYLENSIPSTAFTATGGTITYTDSSGLNPRSSPPYTGGYTVHTFTSSGSFVVNGSVNAEYLVVAGGGGGGGGGSEVVYGGGGAGGVRTGTVAVTSGSKTVTVGNGGSVNSNGQNSVFDSITSTGGGKGNNAVAQTAGSGGSGGGAADAGRGGVIGYGISGQGNNGGYGATDGVNWTSSGGGGGAGAVGESCHDSSGGNGGVGVSSSISGTATYFGGGGGGHPYGSGGTGGGGNATADDSGDANTGGGGGGGYNGGSGGSGVVIVRYKDSDTAPTYNYSTPTGTTVVDGISGKARSFSATNDKVQTNAPTLTGTGDFSISAWINPSSAGTGTTRYIAGNYGTGNTGGIEFYLTTGNVLKTYIGSGINSTGTLSAGSWYHVAVTRESGAIKLYINGAQDGSGTLSGSITGSQNFAIGNGPDYTSERFQGIIDEVVVSNAVRSAEEIAEAYRMGRGHYISRTISSTDLSAKSKIPFYVAADRAGTYLETTIGESAYVDYEPDSNTVGFWHLDEQSGSGAYLKDASDYRNHATPNGTTTFAPGKIGGARSFNGSSGYLTAPDSDNWSFGTGNFTLDFWVNLRSLTTQYSFFTQWVDASNMWTMYRGATTGDIWLLHKTGGTTHGSVGTPNGALPNANTWYHIAAVRNGTNAYIYVNGALAGSSTTYSTNNVGNIAAVLELGKLGGQYIDGLMDEVRISKGIAHTADEIRQAYEIGKRTHSISIDFASALSTADIAGTSEDNAKTDTTFTLANDGMIENIFLGEKIILKENYAGTEYILQGNVSSVSTGTRVITIASWTGTVPPETSTVCGGSNTHCFSANATVFKWQREYMDPTGSLSTQRDAITRLTLKLTDGNESRNVWLDDFKNTSNYLTAPAATSNVFSTANRYMQYRAILSSTDSAVTSYFSSATVNYTEIPLPPTGVSATDGTYTDKVVVSWNASTNATGYKVWNGSSWIDVGNVLSYNDTNAPAPTITPGTASASDGTSTSYVALSLSGNSISAGSVISYKVRAYNGGGDSADSSSDNGNRGAGSLSYQWQRSAADSDASYSDITGGTTSSYNDTGAPLDGSGRYFKCVLSSPGASNATSTADRGYVCGLPVLTTQSPTAILYSSATANGNITSIGLNNPTVRGFKYGLTEADTWTVSESGSFSTGAYTLPLTGLSARTGYSIRAYATNTCGTGYGSYVQFNTGINASPIELKKNIELRKNIELK